MSCQGEVKSYNDGKGWGFITYEGQDAFVHVKDCNGAAPNVGDVVTFDIDQDPVRGGQMKAINVQGCTGDANAGKGKGKGKGSGSCQGTVKSYNGGKGWGFIEYNGVDVFLHVKDCNDGAPQAGDWLTFDVEDAGQSNGKLKATNVSGCTGFPEKGFGKGGMDKGFGKGGGYAPMWGGKGPMWGASPYGGKGMDMWGGGGFGGFGNGKGKGKW